jgi:hypothetical protein
MGIFRASRLAILGVAATAAVALTPTTTLAANAGVGAVVGGGSINPGLSVAAAPQTGSFGGTIAGGGVVNTAPLVIEGSCNFTFSSTGAGDSLATGQGNASGSCSGTLAAAWSASATLTYQRVGGVVVIQGSGNVNGTPAGFTVVCSFEATSAPPVISYQLQCVVIIT